MSLALSAGRARVLSGETLPVEVLVRNDGDVPIELEVGPAHAIVFELRSVPDGPIVATRSRRIALMEALGDRSKPLPPSAVKVLPPGESVRLAEDPAAGSATPIPPGPYLLTARWDIAGITRNSEALSITIDPHSGRQMASLFCPFTGSHAQAFDQDGERTQLYERDTQSQRADAEVFAPRAEVPSVRAMALAVHVAPGLAGRWLGWLEGDSLGALVCLGPGASARPPLARVDLAQPVLVEPALQRPSDAPSHAVFDWGEALFVVAGERDGAGHVQSFVATSDAITPGPVVPLGAAAASRVLARASIATGTIRLVWTESTPDGVRVLTRSYTRDLEPLTSEPSTLYERGSPLLALELEPIDDGRAPGFVHALFGLEGTGPGIRYLVYVRIPLEGPPAVAEKLLVPAPRAAVDGYAISGGTNGELLVLAKVGSSVWRVPARDPSRWQRLIADVPALKHLRLAVAGPHYWAALGLDPARGIVCVPDPDFSREK